MHFQPSPQVIPSVFNPSGFGPPRSITRASTCSWVDHVVSRLPPTTNCRPVQTRFPYGFGPKSLNQAADGNSPDHYAKGTPSHITPKSHSAPTACKRMVSGSHSSPSRGSSHLSIDILSSLSVIREYLALRDGPRRFNRDSTWPDLLRYRSRDCWLSHTGLSPSMVQLSKRFC